MTPKESWNILKYIFYYNNKNIFTLNKIPSKVVLQNQKNFFNFLTSCYLNNIYVYYISSFFKKNSLKAFNKLNLFYQKSQVNAGVVIILENTLSKSLVAKLTNFPFIFVKPVVDSLDFNINIYPIFVNLSDSFQVMMYTNYIKLFLKKSLYTRKLNKSYNFFKLLCYIYK